jgi:hypothetical protein
MSFNVEKDEIIVNDVVYTVEREEDRGHPETTLTIKDFDVNTNDWVFPFDGLEATLAYEEGDISHANPRDWSNVGTMACYHPSYNLGDDVDPRDFLDNEVECDKCKGYGEVDPIAPNADGDEAPVECDECEGTGHRTINIVDWIKKEYGARVIIPLFLYDHSGISMSAGAAIAGKADDSDFDRSRRHPFDSHGWDVSSIGVVFDTPDAVLECMGEDATNEQIEACLRSEVEVYSSYLEGDVTYYSVQDEETNFHDSCFGFVGDHKECERQCFEALESAIVKRLGENNERAEWNARGTETK